MRRIKIRVAEKPTLLPTCVMRDPLVLDRRRFLGVMLMVPGALSVAGKTRIQLPTPNAKLGCDLIDALKARHSTREYSARPLAAEILSTLLWAGFGVNRPRSGGRTAPSAHGWQEIGVYVALPEGLYRFDAPAHALELTVEQDVRALTGVQDFVGVAPVDLVYVADFARMSEASEDDRLFFSACDAAVIAQSVYLYCAAAGLNTVVRGLVDRKRLAAAMRLRREQRIVLAQTVGFSA
ncbi:MAG: SagB/ThcOx family dehydrogenase [Sphingomonadaceae bacterium]